MATMCAYRENKEQQEPRAVKVPLELKDQVVHQEILDDQVYPVSRYVFKG